MHGMQHFLTGTFLKAGRIFSGAHPAKKPAATPSSTAFPHHEVITHRELYPAGDDDPIGHLKLRAENYGALRPDQYYAAFGYLHVPGLVPIEPIDALADEYNNALKSCEKALLRQNSRYEPNQFDSAGAVLNPLLNAHRSHLENPELKNLSERMLDVICNRRLHAALASLTPYPQHCVMQTMIFEQAITSAHQDWTYLDTLPAGHLTAAWIALEDIAPDAARFFVVPGSQNFRHFFSEEAVKNASYIQEMEEIYHERFEASQIVPPMKKGDVVFWNSRLIHGSIPGTNPLRTRLSLAIHTIPKGFRFGNVYREHPVSRRGSHLSVEFI
jgi:phytanoyl-CoA hydroxylase